MAILRFSRLSLPCAFALFLSTPIAGIAQPAPAAGRTLLVDASSPGGKEDGSEGAPFTTIQKAADAAQPGDTVLVRPGIYRESIVLHHGGTPDAPIAFRAAPFGSVTIDGAKPVTGFVPVSAAADPFSVWYCQAYRPLYGALTLPNNAGERWAKQGPDGVAQVERCKREDSIWLDGRRIDEVATLESLAAGAYWIDREQGGLYVALGRGEKIADHTVEASVLPKLLSSVPDCSYVQIKGFHFTRTAGPMQSTAVEIGSIVRNAADKVEGSGRGWIFEDNIVSWGSWCGVAVHGNDQQLLRNAVEWNGNQGIGGSHCVNLLMDGNISRMNNYKKIRSDFEGGGGKFVLSDHVTIRNHEAAYNIGPGIWFDINNKEVRIEHCRLHNNTGGLFMEISKGPTTIVDNLCYANREAGITLGESSNVVIERNILASNRFGIKLRNTVGRHGYGATTPDPSDPDQYQLQDVSIRDNVIVDNTVAGIVNTIQFADPKALRIVSDRNVFFDNPAAQWKLPQGTDATDKNMEFTPETSAGSWILKSPKEAFQKLGLEEHSLVKDPKFKLAFIYEYPWPADYLSGQ